MQAIDETVPATQRQPRCQLLEFVRAIHAIPGLLELPPDTFKPSLRVWHKRALPVVIDARSCEEQWWDFAESWDKVRSAKREGIVTARLEHAKAADPPQIVQAKGYEDDEIILPATRCRELQWHDGYKPVHLSRDTASGVLDMHVKRTYRCLRGASLDEVLRRVRSGNRHRANEYRSLGD
jgi:hypothetical protein